MKPALLAIAVFAPTLGCSPAPVERTEPIRPVKTMVVASSGDVRTRIFPGVAEASRRVELALQVPGLLVAPVLFAIFYGIREPAPAVKKRWQ